MAARWLITAMVLSGCAGFDVGGGARDGGKGGTTNDGGLAGEDVSSYTATGAGPYGDLPTGYCCTTDSDCRDRHCAPGAGMCWDECDETADCEGLGLMTLSCVTDPSSGESGFCEPASSAACVPADEYTHGTKELGDCCTPTHDAQSGRECLGGQCSAFGDGPYICLNDCTQDSDCADDFQCVSLGTYSVCGTADSYGCK